ncbi:MAG: O-antigen ligase family protein [Faecalibacterium prausnitzii]
MKIKVRKKEMEVIPLLFFAIFYTLTRAWCATKLGAISYIAFIGIICTFIVGYIITYKKQSVKICKNSFWICYVLYLAYILLNMLAEADASSYAIFEYVFYMMFLFAMCYVMDNIAFETVLSVYEIIGVIIAIEAIWEFFSGNILFRLNSEIQVIRRAYGLIGSPLTLGMTLACIALISMYRGMISDKKHYLIGLLSIIGLFCTQSRGPLVGFTVGFAIMVFIHNYSMNRNARLPFLEGGLKAVAALCALYILIKWLSSYNGIANTIYQRIQTILVWNSTESANYQRMSKWQEAFDLFKMNPIFGIGVSSTGSRATTGIVLESGVLKKLVETGIMGFALYYYMMIGESLKNIRRAAKHHTKYCALAAGVMSSIFVENFIMQIVESAGVFMIFMWFFTYLIVVNRGGGVWNRIIQKIISTIDKKLAFIGCSGLYSISRSMEVSHLCRC